MGVLVAAELAIGFVVISRDGFEVIDGKAGRDGIGGKEGKVVGISGNVEPPTNLHSPSSKSNKAVSLHRTTDISIAEPHANGYCLSAVFAMIGPEHVHDMSCGSNREFMTNDGQFISAVESVEVVHSPIAVPFFARSIHIDDAQRHIVPTI